MRRAACPEGRGAPRRAALFAACSPSISASARPDLLERERVVTDQARVALDECQRRVGCLPVALDRRRLAPSLDPVVRDRDVDDVRPVLRLAADDERLGEVQADDLGAHLHRPDERSRYSGSEATYAATSAAALSGGEPGRHRSPRPEATTASTSAAVKPDAVERRPDPTGCVGAVTAGAASSRRPGARASRRPVAAAAPLAAADGENGCHIARPNGRERHGDEERAVARAAAASSEPEPHVREVPERRRQPQRREDRGERAAEHRQHPVRDSPSSGSRAASRRPRRRRTSRRST